MLSSLKNEYDSQIIKGQFGEQCNYSKNQDSEAKNHRYGDMSSARGGQGSF